MLDKLIGPVAGLLDKFIVDKDQANALAHEISTMAERHALVCPVWVIRKVDLLGVMKSALSRHEMFSGFHVGG